MNYQAIMRETSGDMALHRAIRDDNFALFRTELERDAHTIHGKNQKGVTPLHLLMGYQRKTMLKALICYKINEVNGRNFLMWAFEKGLDLNQFDCNGETPLHWLAAQPYSQMWNDLRDKELTVNCDIGIRNAVGRTALHVAAFNSDEEVFVSLTRLADFSNVATFNEGLILKRLLRNPWEIQDKWGFTALHYAALSGNDAATSEIIRAKVELYPTVNASAVKLLLPNSKVNGGLTPLSLAVELRWKKVIARLVRSEWRFVKDPITRYTNVGLKHLLNSATSDGLTAFHIAAEEGWVELLRKWNTDFGKILYNAKDNKSRTVMHSAAKNNQLGALKFLVASGGSLTQPDNEGNTALDLAAENGHVNCVRWICERKDTDRIDLKKLNNKHQSPYRLASKHNHISVMDVLKAHGAEDQLEKARRLVDAGQSQQLNRLLTSYPSLITRVDEDSNTLLHHAIISQHANSKAMITKLLDLYANVKAKNKLGQTPAHLFAAVCNFKRDKFKLDALLRHGADLKAIDNKGFTILHYAAQNDEAMLRHFFYSLQDYKDFDSVEGLTPMHMAVLSHKARNVKFLCDTFADRDRTAHPSFFTHVAKARPKTIPRITPLWLALELNNDEILKIFIDQITWFQTVDVDQCVASNGDTLAHNFAAKRDTYYFNRVTETSKKVFAQNQAGYNCLHVATTFGHEDLIKHITDVVAKKHELDLNARTEEGKSAWNIADEKQHAEIKKHLKDKGAKTLPPTISLAKKGKNLINSQSEYGAQLEKTSTYKVYTGLRILLPALASIPAGPPAVILSFAQQLILYGTPTLLQQGSRAYYWVKPYIHNYTNPLVELAFDSSATFGSIIVYRAFEAMWWTDKLCNPVRKVVGIVTSYSLANLASLYTDDIGMQALMFAIGREAGMFAVDAYNNSATDPEAFNYELNRAQTIWGSILGKANGERFVNTVHTFSQLHSSLSQMVGKFEHTMIEDAQELLKALPGYAALQSAVTDGLSFLDSAQSYFTSTQILYAKVQRVQSEINALRNELLLSIEEWLTHQMPFEGNYQAYSNWYLNAAKLSLMKSRAETVGIDKTNAETLLDLAKIDLEQSQQNVAVINPKALEYGYALARAEAASHAVKEAEATLAVTTMTFQAQTQAVAAQATIVDTLWSQTPKAVAAKSLQEAQENELLKKLIVDEANTHVEFWKQHNGDPQKIAQLKVEHEQAKQELNTAHAVAKTAEDNYLNEATSVEKTHYDKLATERNAKSKDASTTIVQQTELQLTNQVALETTNRNLLNAQPQTEATRLQYEQDNV